MEAVVTPIDDLWWTATKFSDVLKVDRRVCQQALETAPYKMIGKRQVWHVREGFEVIFRRKYGLDSATDVVNPGKMPPKDRLDHYKAERERIKLAQEVRVLIPAAEVEQVNGEVLKTVAQGLDVLPDTLERDAGLSPEAVMQVQRTIDRLRDQLYESLMRLTVPPIDV
jgi:hypothetical protein